MRQITQVKVECNTYTFFVAEDEINKVVIMEQHTDFSGTELEQDFPDGDISVWQARVSKGLDDTEAVNLIGGKLLKNWKAI